MVLEIAGVIGLAAVRPCAADASVPLIKRHWVRANVWVAIFSYVGNYFWTHYFYRVLGAY